MGRSGITARDRAGCRTTMSPRSPWTGKAAPGLPRRPGVGCIERRPMTLAEKAEFYEQEIERYIKRTPYGYVAEAPLRKPR